MLAAGELRYKIAIQALVSSRDAMGGTVETWTTQYANVPAAVDDFTGREKFHVESDREISYLQKRIKIRYIRGLSPIHRIIHDGVVYDIVRIEELGFREALRFTVQSAK